jgi:iron complex outermembrane receptor protein
MKPLFILLSVSGCYLSHAQAVPDTASEKPMEEVVIRAFEQKRRIKDVPAAVNYIGRQSMERFSPVSMVPAVNTTPGVRMEERSPGSYRLNIRGSSLRSPFGVRNVKVYFNDIPITDPGGNTYLNQLGYYNFNSIEIVKGPGSSLYGAGTGGAILIESMDENEQAGIASEYAGGGYQLQNIYVSLSTGSKQLVSRGTYQHQENSGYRNQSSLKRDVHSWTGLFRFNEKKLLKVSYLYGDLFYETPGALTRAEYDADPRAARPPGGGFPGAEQAMASIRQKTFMTGLSYVQRFAPRWENKSVLYGMFTELRNPTIRNYGKNSEPHVGGRTQFQYTQTFSRAVLNFILGAEWQTGFSSFDIFKNVNGQPDSLQTHDEVNNRQQFLFSQVALDISSWTILAGGSFNQLRMRFQRFTPATAGLQERKFNNQLAPRVVVMKKIKLVGNGIDLYSGISKGFSPPTTAELLPTGGAINPGLNAEEGTNYEIGLKGNFSGWYVDVNAFSFSLSNTIVQRRDAGGGDFFVNAGKTKQHGVETFLSYPLLQSTAFMDRSLFWFSHTFHDFHYKEFKQLTNDFSGRQLPGDSKHTISTGFDFSSVNGWLGGINYYYSGKIPLNDANTAYADAYHLVGAKLGYKKWVKSKWRIKLAAGVDNLLDAKYSLGNDLNGFGGRYYNAAPGRNFYVSVLAQWISKKIFL